MLKQLYIFLLLCSLIACKSEQWTSIEDIQIEGISATSIIKTGDNYWLADTDNNRVVMINASGEILSEIGELERPMHMSMHNNQLLVPEYLNDTIRRIEENKVIGYIELPETPDAPAGVDIKGDDVLVADFYNHRVIYKKDGKNLTFGKKGKGPGEFHYPTDVQFANDKIYVADAYNNRVQVFDLETKHLLTFGEEEYINAATGIFATDKYVIVTDFENDRVLTYGVDGKLVDVMAEGFYRPTDVIVADGKLHVLNYRGQFISVFE